MGMGVDGIYTRPRNVVCTVIFPSASPSSYSGKAINDADPMYVRWVFSQFENCAQFLGF